MKSTKLKDALLTLKITISNKSLVDIEESDYIEVKEMLISALLLVATIDRFSPLYKAIDSCLSDCYTLGYNDFNYFDAGNKSFHKNVIMKSISNNIDELLEFLK